MAKNTSFLWVIGIVSAFGLLLMYQLSDENDNTSLSKTSAPDFGIIIPQKILPRRYGVVFDLGSSGSRAHVFTYQRNVKQRCEVKGGGGIDSLLPLSFITDKPSSKKTKPPISSIIHTPEKAADALNELFNFVYSLIPVAEVPKTPIFLFATAGLRVIAEEEKMKIHDDDDHDRDNILEEDDDGYGVGSVERLLIELRTFLRTKTKFLFVDNAQVRVLVGEEEGLYDFLSIQQLLRYDPFITASDHVPKEWSQRVLTSLDRVYPASPLYPVMTVDLGGASTQYAFASAPKLPSANNNVDLLEIVQTSTPNLPSTPKFGVSVISGVIGHRNVDNVDNNEDKEKMEREEKEEREERGLTLKQSLGGAAVTWQNGGEEKKGGEGEEEITSLKKQKLELQNGDSKNSNDEREVVQGVEMSNLFANGNDTLRIYTHSFLNYGINRAREIYVDRLIASYIEEEEKKKKEGKKDENEEEGKVVIADSCFNQNVACEEYRYRKNNKTYTICGDVDSSSTNCITAVDALFSVNFPLTCTSPSGEEYDCNFRTYNVVKKPENYTVVAFDHAYRVVKNLGLYGAVQLRRIRTALFEVGRLNYELYQQQHPHVSEIEFNKLLFEATYVYRLLYTGYKLPMDSRIMYTDIIGGYDMNWALGAIVYESYRLCKEGVL